MEMITKATPPNMECTLPKVTVIIPSFNHARWVETAIRSVLSQTYENIELVIVDDGSSDGSHGVLSAYSSHPNVTVILNKLNRGQGAVINQAFQVTTGSFVCFLPSDDWFLPNKIQLQIDAFRNSGKNVGVIYGRGLRFYEDSGETRPIKLPMHRGFVLKHFIVGGNFIYPVTPMFRRECFDLVAFDESYSAEGESIYVKIARYFEFDFVEDVVAVMRDHTYNTGKNRSLMYSDNLRWWEDYFRDPTLPVWVRRLRGVPLGRLHRLHGLERLKFERDHRAAAESLISALRHRPRYILDWKLMAALILCLLGATKFFGFAGVGRREN